MWVRWDCCPYHHKAQTLETFLKRLKLQNNSTTARAADFGLFKDLLGRQRRMWDLKDLDHLSFIPGRSRLKPRMGLTGHKLTCVFVLTHTLCTAVGKEAGEAVKCGILFKTQGLLSYLIKSALIRCWLHFSSWTQASRAARHTVHYKTKRV